MPVPTRIGDPSTIKHVFLIVKENRTYDQVFGDMPQGNGDPTLTQFGENVTPNQHALAEQFGLYDNIYDIGTNSAEGHNWLMQADNPEYTESSAGEYLRSYDTEDDALGHQRSGFLWTGAQAAGKTVRDFGEFQQFRAKPAGATWQHVLLRRQEHGRRPGQPTTANQVHVGSPIPSLNDVPNHGFPKFDTSDPGHLPVRDLEAGLREERPGQPEHVLALQRPHRWPAEPGRAGRRQRPRRRQDRRRRSRTASTGRTRRSSWSRTTARPAPTTSTATAPRSRSSAPGPSTAWSTTPTTRRSR